MMKTPLLASADLQYFYVAEGSAQFLGRGPMSYMISLWQDQTSLMASGVPIPAPLGSPAGPNQWFCGAPVVLARIPAYVVPLTDLPSTSCRNNGSFETTAAVRCAFILSQASNTNSS
uniref:Uncharacterized protein n=1 Tax=Arundo donax TaxID=35708 RepID=A0A0A9CU93_ARUDO